MFIEKRNIGSQAAKPTKGAIVLGVGVLVGVLVGVFVGVLVGVFVGVTVIVGVGVGVGVVHGQRPVETTETLPPLILLTTGVVVDQIDLKLVSSPMFKVTGDDILPQHGVNETDELPKLPPL